MLYGLLWLIVFFAIPLANQAYISLQSGDPELGYTFTWEEIRDPARWIRRVSLELAATP